MLWQKESEDPAMYADLFSSKYKNIMLFYAHTRSTTKNTNCDKDDKIAYEKRKEGNESFRKKDWLTAIYCYHESLSYATPGSENIGLAYANRSACFLHEKKYRKCLADIELAKKAGYPANLMPKLIERENECKLLIDQGADEDDDFGLKLSYDPDEKFPCMANVLKIDRNSKGDVVLVAKEDIEVGKTIVVDKAFTTCLYSRYGWRCNICLKNGANLIPCEKCNVAMFCSEECRNDAIHAGECGIKFSDRTQQNGIVMNEVRAMFKIINMFPNVDELIDFVEAAIKSDPKEIPSSLADEKSRYRAFLKLPYDQLTAADSGFRSVIFAIYKTIIDIPKMSEMFNTQKYRRFLMHLVMHQGIVTDGNSIRTRLASIDPNPSNRRDIVCQTSLLRNYFRHSCAPNVFNADRDGYGIYITMRPVKKGEKLLVTLYDLTNTPKEQRQQILKTEKHFKCTCIRCVDRSATSRLRKQFKSDSLVKALFDKQTDSFDKCVAVMQKYGSGPWFEELSSVYWIFNLQLQNKLTGPTNIHSFAHMLAESLQK